MKRSKNRLNHHSGQVLIETVIVILILFIMALGLVQLITLAMVRIASYDVANALSRATMVGNEDKDELLGVGLLIFAPHLKLRAVLTKVEIEPEPTEMQDYAKENVTILTTRIHYLQHLYLGFLFRPLITFIPKGTLFYDYPSRLGIPFLELKTTAYTVKSPDTEFYDKSFPEK